MRRRGDVNAGTRSSASRGSARRNRALALAILALLGLATVAPAGQADGQSSSERAAQRAVQSAERTAQREAVRMQREAARNARKAAKADEQAQRTAEREAARLAALVTPHATVELQCRKIVVRYTGFNGLAGMPNVAVQHVIFRHRPGGPPTYLFPAETFSFEGSEATETIPIAAPLGTSGISMRSRFEGPSVKGGFHVRGPITCGPIPQYSLETLQSTGGALTSAPLAATVGQAVTYETLATNTGNTPLTFTGFSDPGCDSMLADGQPGAVAPHSSVTFLCSHSLTNADRTAGFFANAAGLTGTPGPGEGEPITSTSNGLLVAPIGAGAETPKPEASKEVTAAAAPATAGPRSGVLSFSPAAIPSLRGPSRCVRSTFTISVKSTGVSNVTFYIDGRKLARRTAHSAHNGTISIKVNGAKLKAGTHKLSASITMTAGSPPSKAVVATRTRKLRRCSVKHN